MRKTLIAAFALAVSFVCAGSGFDWAGVDGVVSVPDGVAAEITDADRSAVQALRGIILEGSKSQIVFNNTEPLELSASITGKGGGGSACHNIIMSAASSVVFNGDVRFESGNTYITLGNATVNAVFGSDGNYYYVTALSGCTVRYSQSAQLIRRYLGYFYGPGTHRFACRVPYGNNVFEKLIIDGANAVLDADDIVAFNVLDGANGSSSTFTLNGHDVKVLSVIGGSVQASATPHLMEVTSLEPASITYNISSHHTYVKTNQVSSVFYTGAVTLNVEIGSDFTNRIVNGTSTTSGDLNIVSGTFAIDGVAQWKGPSVNVSGGRLIASSSSGSLSENTVLNVSGTGVVRVPRGYSLLVDSLNVNGNPVAIDEDVTIAELAADYPGFFEGEGSVSVLKPYIFVDEVKGDDVNNSGRTAAKPFKTLKRAMEAALRGYTVFVAPGAYGDESSDDVMGSSGDYSRVVVPEGVTLKSTGSAADTFIFGRRATDPVADQFSNSLSGADSARCVMLSAGARIEGFTLTGGCATWDGTAKSGGGVYAANNTDCRVVGCIISNCYSAATGSAGENGVYLRCRVSDNNKGGAGYAYGLRVAKVYNCLFINQTDGVSTSKDAYHCTFHKKYGQNERQMHNGEFFVKGCVFMSNSAPGIGGSTVFRSSLCLQLPNNIDLDASIRAVTWQEIAIAENGAPSADSAAIDFGDTWEDYISYMVAAGWTQEEASIDYLGNARCRNGRVDAGCCEYDESSEMAIFNWFVDDVAGNDGNHGRNRLWPKKTIKAAIDNAMPGDVINVAEGVYGDEPSDEVMGTEGDFSRIVIPDDVTLKATGRPEKTIIVGRKATKILSGGGCGTDSARCVYLSDSAKLIGFTLTGGYSTTTSDDPKDGKQGGGFATRGSTFGVIVGCIVSNNVASSHGGTCYGGKCFGCFFYDNTAVGVYGRGVRYAQLYNCVLKDSSGCNGIASVCYAIVNCTVINPGVGNQSLHSCTSSDVINSVFVTDSALPSISSDTKVNTYRNCLFTKAPDAKATVDEYSKVVTEAELKLNDAGFPSAKTSVAVDFGSYAHYESAVESVANYAKTDVLGRERVANGVIDAGAVEYDWRADYARDLGRMKWLSVDAASGAVTETSAGSVRLVDGASIALTFTVDDVNGESFVWVPFTKNGQGTLEALLDGQALEMQENGFFVPAAAAKMSVVLSYAGDGYADISRMRRRCRMVLIVE